LKHDNRAGPWHKDLPWWRTGMGGEGKDTRTGKSGQTNPLVAHIARVGRRVCSVKVIFLAQDAVRPHRLALHTTIHQRSLRTPLLHLIPKRSCVGAPSARGELVEPRAVGSSFRLR